MRQSILFGNGFNRLSENVKDWNEIMKSISSDGEVINGIANTMQYENLILTSRVVPADTPKKILSNSLEYRVKYKIGELVADFRRNDFFDLLADCNVQHYLTTNYDMALDKSMPSLGFAEVPALRDSYESIYSIHRKRVYVSEDDPNCMKNIWPIHGEKDYPTSIMIGYDHYCGSIAKISQVVKGGYELKKKDAQKIPSIINRIKEANNDIYTWPDLFFLSDLHIIGLGLTECEIDIWWLLNRRKRLISEGYAPINNKIYYYGVIEQKYKELLESFDVIVFDCKAPKKGRTWKPLYNKMIGKMNENISLRI